MKKILIISTVIVMALSIVNAQDAKKGDNQYSLTSEKLAAQGKQLDTEILELNKKFSVIIKKYELMKAAGIRVLPYQTSYSMGKDYIELEKHYFIKDSINTSKISGISIKNIKIFTNGQTVTRVESEISESNYYSGEKDMVKIIDPSPLTENTDDMIFTRTIKGKMVLKDKLLGKVKNSTAYPIRNELKRAFLIPHLSFFVDSLRFIAEAYTKSFKDSENGLAEFLKKSTHY